MQDTKKRRNWAHLIWLLVAAVLVISLCGRAEKPSESPTPTPTIQDVATKLDPLSELRPTPSPLLSDTSGHNDIDDYKGELGTLITAHDFEEYCAVIRDGYWHLMDDHEDTTFVFVHVTAVSQDVPVNGVAQRLTMCGLDLNGDACVGPACDWESPPKLGPDLRIVEPPKFKEGR